MKLAYLFQHDAIFSHAFWIRAEFAAERYRWQEGLSRSQSLFKAFYFPVELL